MGFRFRKSFKLAPGVRLNVSRRGLSTSLGRRGATVTLGSRRKTVTLGIPGTGLSYTTAIGGRGKRQTSAPPSALPSAGAPPRQVELLAPDAGSATADRPSFRRNWWKLALLASPIWLIGLLLTWPVGPLAVAVVWLSWVGYRRWRRSRRVPAQPVAHLLLVATALLASPFPAAAQQQTFCGPGQAPRYVFGFADLKEQLGEAMGEPLTCEFPDPNGTGDVHQQTTTGLAFWRKRTNTPTFTNGWEHWGRTPAGWVYWLGSSIDPASDVVPWPLMPLDAPANPEPPKPLPPLPPPPAPTAPYYPSCAAARQAGAAPIYRGQPGYRAGLDRDNDGIACD